MILKGKFGFGEGEGIAWFPGGKKTHADARAGDGPVSLSHLRKVFQSIEKELLEEKRRLKKGEEFLAFPLAILQDPELWKEVRGRMDAGEGAVRSVTETFAAWERKFKQLADPYLRLRSRDLADLRLRIVSMLAGDAPGHFPDRPFVAVARDLYVTDFLQWRRFPLRGVCLENGNEASHGVMLARAVGIPVVGGVKGALKHCRAGQSLAIREDRVYIGEKATLSGDENRSVSFQKRATPLRFVTRDQVEIVVRANVHLVEEAARARALGAKGIGLFRTEFLQMSGKMTLKEEVEAYRSVLRTFHPEPVVFRLLDFGSDKPLKEVKWPDEKNPALGWRGLRLLLDHPAILKRQLEALFSASEGMLHLLLPMVRTAEEVRCFFVVLRRLEKKYRIKSVIGMMIETPAAAYLFDQLPGEIRFVSLGTNDLAQYFFAIDRGHPRLTVNPLDPAFVRFLREIVERARLSGRSLSLCGELAGDPRALPVLLGLGIRELSVSVSRLEAVSGALSRISTRVAAKAVERLLRKGNTAPGKISLSYGRNTGSGFL